MQAGELEQVVSGASEGSGGQLARTSSHYMGPVASDSLAHTWMHHAWADAGHVLNRCPCSHTPGIPLFRASRVATACSEARQDACAVVQDPPYQSCVSKRGRTAPFASLSQLLTFLL